MTPRRSHSSGRPRAPSSDKHDIRKEICGFANGRQPAYLILGASESEEGWVLDGVDLGGDPPAWISDVVGDGLRPVPPFDVRSLPVEEGKHVAVVEVPPIAVAPCISRGTVYERVSGKTKPVKEPARLAELYKRGENARVLAVTTAGATATELIQDSGLKGHGSAWPRLALAVTATAYSPDIIARLFSEDFEEALLEIVRQRLIPNTAGLPGPFAPALQAQFAQSNRSVDCEDTHTHASPFYWHVRGIWDGTIVIYAAWETNTVFAEHIVKEMIEPAWHTALELLNSLGGYGPTYTEMRIEGGSSLYGPGDSKLPRIMMGRGPMDGMPSSEVMASVERELRRACGEHVYENLTTKVKG